MYLKVIQQHFGVFQRVILLQAKHLPVKEGQASETVGKSQTWRKIILKMHVLQYDDRCGLNR